MIVEPLIQSYRKRPVVIEAARFSTNNEPETRVMDAIVNWINQGKNPDEPHAWHNSTNIFIQTLEGLHTANVGDFIIKGIKGEFYPCKPDIFQQTYEKIE